MLQGLKALGLASLAALATQPLMFAASLWWLARLGGPGWQSAEFQHVAGYFVILTGVYMIVAFWPTFFLLRRMDWLDTGSVALAGGMLGALPAVLLCFVARFFSGAAMDGDWHGQQVDYIVDNSITLHGWLMYSELCLVAGLHGLASAFAFWHVWRRVR